MIHRAANIVYGNVRRIRFIDMSLRQYLQIMGTSALIVHSKRKTYAVSGALSGTTSLEQERNSETLTRRRQYMKGASRHCHVANLSREISPPKRSAHGSPGGGDFRAGRPPRRARTTRSTRPLTSRRVRHESCNAIVSLCKHRAPQYALAPACKADK